METDIQNAGGLKRAIFVFGPESSGTRLWTRILMACGCAGSGGHEQRWDIEPFVGDLIVWRRSFPHGGEWPDIKAMTYKAESSGYRVTACVMARDPFAVLCSQVAAGHVKSLDEALERTRRAYPIIFTGLAAQGLPLVIIRYEQMMDQPYRAKVLAAIGLSEREPAEPILDGNAKYFARVPFPNHLFELQ